MRLIYTIIMIFVLVLPASTEETKSELVIGLIPEENIFRQMDRYRPLGEYLTEKLNIKVHFTILSRYGDNR